MPFFHMGFPTEDDCRRAANLLITAGIPFHLLSNNDDSTGVEIEWLHDNVLKTDSGEQASKSEDKL